MELYSKEELLKELKKEYSCGGECDHCPEVLDAGSCAVLRCIRRIIDNASPVFSCNACKNMGNEWECLDCHDYSNYVYYEERPQGEWIKNEGKDIRDNFYTCSKCGRTVNVLCGETLSDYPFCHCGAKMKGGAE